LIGVFAIPVDDLSDPDVVGCYAAFPAKCQNIKGRSKRESGKNISTGLMVLRLTPSSSMYSVTIERIYFSELNSAFLGEHLNGFSQAEQQAYSVMATNIVCRIFDRFYS
jgi:hypothetical protein